MMYLFSAPFSLFAAPGDPCDLTRQSISRVFLNFPTWYEYLPGVVDNHGTCSPAFGGLNDVWLVAAAIIDILLRLAALMAIGFIIWGGAKYVLSQGDPEQAKRAQGTIVNAVIGLILTIVATGLITFVAGRFR